MRYRTLGKTGLKVSEIGFGGKWLERHDEEESVQLLRYAADKGINIIDCWMPDPKSRDIIGKAMEGNRESSVIASAPLHSYAGQCTYCGHCKPCPVNIDIAMVNKFYDLAVQQQVVPESVKAHYEALGTTASACIGCRSCESRCPFGVEVSERMKKTAELFGC